MVKQLKLYRKSGLPVNLSDRTAYEEAWRNFYDKATARAGLNMEKMQRFCSFGERALVRKYNIEVSVTLPTSARGWTKLVQSFEDCPIIVARAKNGKDVVGIIIDDGSLG